MKKSLNKIIALSVLVIGLVAGLTLSQNNQNINKKAAPATSLSLSPSSQEISIGNDFTTQIEIDTGANKVTGVDVKLSFDSSKLKINEIKATTELASFNTINKNEIDNTNGKLRYSTFTFDKNLGISGKLNILTISGSVLSSAVLGQSEISFDPTTIVIAVSEGQNVLVNSSSATIKVIEPEPNSCGGTCGSNFNCKANYFCFEGYCRNPVCQSDSDCNCTAAATTAPVVKATKKPTPKPTATSDPKGGTTTYNYDKPVDNTPQPTTNISLESIVDNPVTTDDLKNQVINDFIKYLIGLITLIGLGLLGYILWKKNKKDTPHILPPTNI